MVTVHPPLDDKCVGDGHRINRELAQGITPYTMQRAYRDIEKDPTAQADAKRGQCIFALTYGLDPMECFEEPGRSWHFRTRSGVKAVAKRTVPNYRYLIWPLPQKKDYLRRDFDLLALVKNRGPTGFVRGFMWKQEFYDRVQQPGWNPLDNGTWAVLEGELRSWREMPGHEIIEDFFSDDPILLDPHLCECGAYGPHGTKIGRDRYIWTCGKDGCARASD
jgi:hypothetical protein